MVINSSITVTTLAPVACVLAALGWASLTSAAPAAGTEEHSQHHGASAAMVDGAASGAMEQESGGDQGMRCGGDGHAHHRAMMAKKGYQRSEHAYALRDYKLVDMGGEETSLLKELDTDRPVMVNFIFTTCTTICPVMSGVFSQVQKELGPESGEVRMISVSIDPEYDNPERLRDYAQRFGAGPQWQFLTGDLDDIVAVQKAFDVYRGNKMSHEPTTLLRKSEKDPWVRLDGIASAAEIVAEYRQLAGR
jgi:protein SCO1/2